MRRGTVVLLCAISLIVGAVVAWYARPEGTSLEAHEEMAKALRQCQEELDK
jgi:hypothetical protein